MSELSTIKSRIQTIPIRGVNKDPAQKEQNKKKKGKELPQEEENDNSEEHVNEYI